MKIAFGSVVYKEGLLYADEFIDSLNQQTGIQNVDVVLLNDNLSAEDMNNIISKLNKPPIILYNDHGLKPHELRVELIRKTKRMGYDLLIFGDFDDTWSNDRIEQYIDQFQAGYAFFYNDLYKRDGTLFFSSTPFETESYYKILESNYLGLSTTGIVLPMIEETTIDMLGLCQQPVFDWYLYTILLKLGHKGKKIVNAKTYYRLHANNLAGIVNISDEHVIKELNVKIDHYNSLRSVGAEFQKKHSFYSHLYNVFFESPNKLIEYVDLSDNYWWGLLKESKLKGVITNEYKWS